MKGKSRNSISRFFLYNFDLINIDVLMVLVFSGILVLKSVANPLDKWYYDSKWVCYVLLSWIDTMFPLAWGCMTKDGEKNNK